MTIHAVRPASLDDLPALTDIYNHYVVNTTITFDLRPFTPEERRSWFDDHAPTGRHRLIVAADRERRASRICVHKPLAAQGGVRHNRRSQRVLPPKSIGRGCGTATLRRAVRINRREDVHRIVAGVSLPNPASIKLHERFGFRPVGVFPGVGRKFDKYWDVAWFERPLRL